MWCRSSYWTNTQTKYKSQLPEGTTEQPKPAELQSWKEEIALCEFPVFMTFHLRVILSWHQTGWLKLVQKTAVLLVWRTRVWSDHSSWKPRGKSQQEETHRRLASKSAHTFCPDLCLIPQLHVCQIQEVHLRLKELSRDFSCCQLQGNLNLKFKAGLVNFLLKQSRLFERIKQNPVSLQWLCILSGIKSKITRHGGGNKRKHESQAINADRHQDSPDVSKQRMWTSYCNYAQWHKW